MTQTTRLATGSPHEVVAQLQSRLAAAEARVKVLEEALKEAHPFVEIYVAHYAREHAISESGDVLHPTHQEIVSKLRTLTNNRLATKEPPHA